MWSAQGASRSFARRQRGGFGRFGLLERFAVSQIADELEKQPSAPFEIGERRPEAGHALDLSAKMFLTPPKAQRLTLGVSKPVKSVGWTIR